MEDKSIARDAIENSRRWLSSANVNAKVGNYDLAVYSLEMSVEIALKALLFSIGIDVPKTHSVGDIVVKGVKEDGVLSRMIGGEIDGFVRTFNSLSTLRSMSGYIFETRSTLKDMKSKYEKFAAETERVVDLCGKAVNKRSS